MSVPSLGNLTFQKEVGLDIHCAVRNAVKLKRRILNNVYGMAVLSELTDG
jgi:hypothetical protein